MLLDVVDGHSKEGVLDAYGHTGEAPLVFRWVLAVVRDGRVALLLALGWGRSVVFFGSLLQSFLVRHMPHSACIRVI